MNNSGKFAVVKFTETNTFEVVPIGFIKDLHDPNNVASDQVFSVFYTDEGETPQSVLHDQGKISNIDELRNSAQGKGNRRELERLENATGYYFARVLVIKDTQKAAEAFLGSKEGRKVLAGKQRSCKKGSSDSVSQKEKSSEALVKAGSATSMKRLAESLRGDDSKRQRGGNSETSDDEEGDPTLVDSNELKEKVNQVKSTWKGKLRDLRDEYEKKLLEQKAESDRDYSLLAQEHAALKLQYDAVKNIDTPERFNEFQGNYSILEKKYCDLQNVHTALTAKMVVSEKKIGYWKEKFDNADRNLSKLMDRFEVTSKKNIELQTFILKNGRIGDRSSAPTVHSPIRRPLSSVSVRCNRINSQSSDSPQTPPRNPSISFHETPRLSQTQAGTSDSSVASSSVSNEIVNSTRNESLHEDAGPYNFFDDDFVSEVSQPDQQSPVTQQSPPVQPPIVERPQVHLDTFHVEDSAEGNFRRINDADFATINTALGLGLEKDNLFVKQALSRAFEDETLAASSVTGREKNKENQKNQLDRAGVDHVRKWFMKRLRQAVGFDAKRECEVQVRFKNFPVAVREAIKAAKKRHQKFLVNQGLSLDDDI